MRIPGRLRYHLAGRQHAEDRNRRRHADAPVSFRRLDSHPPAPTPAGRAIRSPVGTWPPPSGGTGWACPRGTHAQSLEVVTTHLRAGYLRKNGVPYSDKTTLTEYYDRFDEPNGDSMVHRDHRRQRPGISEPFLSSPPPTSRRKPTAASSARPLARRANSLERISEFVCRLRPRQYRRCLWNRRPRRRSNAVVPRSGRCRRRTRPRCRPCD